MSFVTTSREEFESLLCDRCLAALREKRERELCSPCQERFDRMIREKFARETEN